VAELLALAVTQEGPVGALERVNRLSGEELSPKLSPALDEARAGVGLVQALGDSVTRTSLAPQSRRAAG